MAGIGPGADNLVGAFLNEQADASQTASELLTPFRDYLTAAATARNAAAENAQSQLDALEATEDSAQAALQNTITSDETVASSLTGLADAMAQNDQVAAIQRFKLDNTAESADFATLATLDENA
jgi:hypothetical protein